MNAEIGQPFTRELKRHIVSRDLDLCCCMRCRVKKASKILFKLFVCKCFYFPWYRPGRSLICVGMWNDRRHQYKVQNFNVILLYPSQGFVVEKSVISCYTIIQFHSNYPYRSSNENCIFRRIILKYWNSENGNLRLKSDGITFRVKKNAILESDMNYRAKKGKLARLRIKKTLKQLWWELKRP